MEHVAVIIVLACGDRFYALGQQINQMCARWCAIKIKWTMHLSAPRLAQNPKQDFSPFGSHHFLLLAADDCHIRSAATGNTHNYYRLEKLNGQSISKWNYFQTFFYDRGRLNAAKCKHSKFHFARKTQKQQIKKKYSRATWSMRKCKLRQNDLNTKTPCSTAIFSEIELREWWVHLTTFCAMNVHDHGYYSLSIIIIYMRTISRIDHIALNLKPNHPLKQLHRSHRF